MAGMDWFRWHHGSVNDPKFQLVAKRAGASVAEVVAVWACLLEAASSADERGNVGSPDFEAIDCAMGLDDGKAGLIYAAMTARNLVGDDGSVTSWFSRQSKREREDGNSTARVKAFRGRTGDVTPTETMKRHETPCNAKKSPEEIRVEKRREIQGESASERGRDEPPPIPPDGGPPPFPPEFQEFIKTERPELDPSLVFRTFCGHYQPRKRTQATWQKWVLREMAPPAALARDSPQAAVSDPDSRASVEARAVALGLGRWNEAVDQWSVYRVRVIRAEASAALGVAA